MGAERGSNPDPRTRERNTSGIRRPPDQALRRPFAWGPATCGCPPTDKTYANQRKAGEILEKVFAEQPNHPGVAHYIIHSYDNPVLAEHALTPARSYAKIAPSVPHAQHMPSHVFIRLGLWQEAIASNLASAAAAREYEIKSHMEGVWDQRSEEHTSELQSLRH